MKTSNNSPADNEVAKNDTPNALISDNDLLKFFNLEKENVQDFSITHRKDGMYVNITLNKTWVQCPVCGHMTSRVKDYTDKKITHSVMTTTNCYIIYHARRYECLPHRCILPDGHEADAPPRRRYQEEASSVRLPKKG